MEQAVISASVNELKSVLENKGFLVQVLFSEKEVKEFINNSIPDQTIVGLGYSMTSCKLNIRNILSAKGSQIFYSWDGTENYNRSIDTFESKTKPDYYITRINALTRNGEILMKDFDKNASLKENFPLQVMAFVGLNRVVEKFGPSDSSAKYTVIDKCPANTKWIISLLPFLDY